MDYLDYIHDKIFNSIDNYYFSSEDIFFKDDINFNPGLSYNFIDQTSSYNGVQFDDTFFTFKEKRNIYNRIRDLVSVKKFKNFFNNSNFIDDNNYRLIETISKQMNFSSEICDGIHFDVKLRKDKLKIGISFHGSYTKRENENLLKYIRNLLEEVES